MLKTNFTILLGLLLLTFSLAGCGLAGAEEKSKAEPLNIADWPSPPPTPLRASATPFPKITLAPTATPTTRPPAPTATPTAGAEAALSPVSGAEALTQQLGSAILDRLPPVAVALVINDKVPVRQGPGASYGSAGTLERGELVGVLGKNSGGEWLYTVNASLLHGWLPVEVLRVTGSLDQAPVLPADPVAAAIATALPASAGASNAGTSTTASRTLTPTDLQPVATARVNNATLNLRQRPGADFKLLGRLSRDDEVTLLALNRDREWALVKTADQKFGWASVDFLDINGSLAGAPQVLSLTPGQNDPADQIAPIVALGGAAATTGEAGSIQSNNGAAGAEPVSFNPAAAGDSNAVAAFGPLGPVTTARIARGKVEIRPGPGSEYAPIDELSDDQESLPILALDQSQRWALLKSASAEAGWVALDDLVIEGSLAGAPQVFTAWVQSNAVEVRRGPGIFYDLVGNLSINTLVRVLGLNEGRSWALVQPIGGESFGWAPLTFLTVGARPADLPQAPDLPLPDQNASAGQPVATPPIPPRPIGESQIVFQTASGGPIMVINPDGSGLRQLTYGLDPVLSPDGQTVAFTRWQGETGSLWLINIDGNQERSILDFIKQAKGPEWSPDGSKIVLNFQQGGRLEAKEECFNLASGSPPRPPRNASRPVARRSEGKVFLCWTVPPDPHWNLRLVNLADGSFSDVDGGTYAFRPAWDPTRPWRIISDGGAGLVEIDLNRAHQQTLTDEVKDGSPVFSPDGRYLAVTVGQQGGSQDYNIHRLNADGSGRLALTSTPLWVTTGPEAQKAWNNVAPAWSPDGSQIAFLTDRTGRWEIWVMNVDGSNPHPLFSDRVNDQLQISYNFVDERVLSWR